ncbi:C40 family peptidase [Kineothrix sp. MSJ-39]|uniref:C40 family peptidase n=1 Tax=Kineothrix sp. MSJ-39 TaxID=2841533 RepID=UPI001C127FAF|nr:C40 family peptidase [Kineothrix sp. MSJ-39]MBU5430372.1 C40 family peptidase [Kineothrix sp. MSJ-39]
MQKRVCCILLSLIMVMEIVVPVRATTISGVKKEQQKTQNNLNSVNQQITAIQSNQAQAQEELDQLSDQLVDILTSIDICQDEIAVKEKEIEQAKKDYEDAQKKEDDQYASMKKRIQFMYEQGDSAYLQVLLESQNYADMVNKADYIESLYEYDKQLLSDYVESKNQVAELKGRLEDEEADLQASNYELQQEEAALQTLVDEQKKTVANFDAQLASAKKKAATYKQQLEDQTAQIKKLEEEAAAKKKKEEEAKKKQEQERKQQQQQANQTPTVDTGNESQQTTGDDPAQVDTGDDSQTTDPGTVDTGNDSKGTDSMNAGAGAVTGGSGVGQQAANYACNFVGNPYKFGGTSLTNGTDCSGFTQAVYAHFGISLPRDSYSQRSCGTEVSYANAQPGDIICYAGHVALYLGNGQIVHASTERTGITYGYATYRTILSVRRVS